MTCVSRIFRHGLPAVFACALLAALASCSQDAPRLAPGSDVGSTDDPYRSDAAVSAVDAVREEDQAASQPSQPAAPQDGATSAVPSEDAKTATTSPPSRTARVATASSRTAVDDGRTLDKSFDDIKFDMEVGERFERSMLTDEIESLRGRSIRIRGYIYPSAQKRLSQFVLVRDNLECCFGPGAALFDCIVVDMKPGKLAEFSIRPVAVEGTFDIRPLEGPDGSHMAIYHLEAESVD